MPIILSGKVARDELKKSLAFRIAAFQKRRGFPLTLAIIQVGDRADSTAYINAKKKFASEIGVLVKLVHFGEGTRQKEIIDEIKKLNQDKEISGIIVQLPLPKKMDERIILDAVDPSKDADATSSLNVEKWMAHSAALYPATARGIGELLDFYKIDIKGKRVCIIGRSPLVGKPIACLCSAKGAFVTVCHSKTVDLVKETLAADVIITAVGKPALVTAAHLRSGQAVIDVGISDEGVKKPDDGVSKRKLVGDVDFENVRAALGKNGAISPVPGGVGPMTVLALFENLVDCAKI
ncbi:MAG: bifunctional 5,10-methylenetetrahydrofolate dehydrogenase/5,10-methenyltetrahydrofolate cyclohydrolase [Candidatus Pacebacteria bacterium]|nr:bifunctional 5,10-methylenetetrahydrofolate dehydrogenase/5,10-methenyltetrahydrofolate cyclohydrolase [Candidatus Paceibacterota bacterium]